MDSTRRLLAVVASAGSLAVAACASPTVPGPNVLIELAAREYALPAQGPAEISYSVLNGGTTVAWLTSRCGDRVSPAIERRDARGWQQYAGGVCITSLDMSPMPLDAGARRDDATRIGVAGEYRLVIGTDRGPSVSPPFVVR